MSHDGEHDSTSGDTGNTRRRFLTVSTTVVGAVGVVGAAVPFIGSWNPSAKARAAGAPVKVNIGKLEEDSIMTAEWQGFPVFILRRSQTTIDNLAKMTERVADPNSEKGTSKQPEYCKNPLRSMESRPDIMVFKAICTHLGCVPEYWDIHAETTEDDWLGGFFCPCHGSLFDLAGRVFNGVPAPDNLEVPPYRFESDNVITIGLNPEEASS